MKGANVKRYALISLVGTSVSQLEAYLPANYKKVGYAPHNPDAPGSDPTYHGPCIVIEGCDNCGWTLEGYVIPRLQSGLHVVREIALSHPVMKTIERR